MKTKVHEYEGSLNQCPYAYHATTRSTPQKHFFWHTWWTMSLSTVKKIFIVGLASAGHLSRWINAQAKLSPWDKTPVTCVFRNSARSPSSCWREKHVNFHPSQLLTIYLHKTERDGFKVSIAIRPDYRTAQLRFWFLHPSAENLTIVERKEEKGDLKRCL